MSEDNRDLNAYLKAYEREEQLHLAKIGGNEGKAFEYGVIVVKNSVFISGGSLLSIPAIVGLSNEVKMDVDAAMISAACFAVSLLITIIGAYVVHMNWMFHARAAQIRWKERSEMLVAIYLDRISESEVANLKYSNAKSFAINVTFYVPHLFVPIYFFMLILGFLNLYRAFVLV